MAKIRIRDAYSNRQDIPRKTYKCSNCGKTVTKYYNYCPYCGEKFEKENNNERN